MQLSIVVPVRNEEENILPLLAEIHAALEKRGESRSFMSMTAASDATSRRLAEAVQRYPGLRVLAHRVSCGQSTALTTGIRAARGEWVATLDGDGQNDPADIPKLLAARDSAGVSNCSWSPVTERSAAIRGSSACHHASPTACAQACSGMRRQTPAAGSS